MRVGPLLLGLLLGVGLTCAAVGLRAGALRRASPPEHHRSPTSIVDWSRVSSRDLDVASLFVTARRSGVRAAMDSLDALAGRDSALALLGHAVAHGLGRFAVAERPDDRSLFGQCTAAFNSGCYHGVLEGYLAAPGEHPPVERLCDAVSGGGQPPYARRECAHGMGHALMGVNGGNPEPSLRGCDRLAEPEERSDCWEGVYMEDLLRATDAPVVNAGDSAVARHARGHGARPAGRCDQVAPTYRAACWAYQPVALLGANGGDAVRTLKACRAAPDRAARESCWSGFGKQTAGRIPNRPDTLGVLCAADGSDAEAACLDGAVEYHVERRWSAEPGRAFCESVPAPAQPTCFASLGAHAALIYPQPQAAEHACAGVADRYLADCRRGASSPRS
jgi:hypothetical protein